MKITICKHAPLLSVMRFTMKVGGTVDPKNETIEVDDGLTVTAADTAARQLGLELIIPGYKPKGYMLRLSAIR